MSNQSSGNLEDMLVEPIDLDNLQEIDSQIGLNVGQDIFNGQSILTDTATLQLYLEPFIRQFYTGKVLIGTQTFYRDANSQYQREEWQINEGGEVFPLIKGVYIEASSAQRLFKGVQKAYEDPKIRKKINLYHLSKLITDNTKPDSFHQTGGRIFGYYKRDDNKLMVYNSSVIDGVDPPYKTDIKDKRHSKEDKSTRKSFFRFLKFSFWKGKNS